MNVLSLVLAIMALIAGVAALIISCKNKGIPGPKGEDGEGGQLGPQGPQGPAGKIESEGIVKMTGQEIVAELAKLDNISLPDTSFSCKDFFDVSGR